MAIGTDEEWPLAGESFAAVLFDNDGTLINSDEAVISCWSQWAEEFDVPYSALENMHGIPAVTLVRRLIAPDRQEEALARIDAIELACEIPSVALPGSIDALAAVNGRGAIVTSARTDLFQIRARQSRLPLPSVIVTIDDITNGKPHPEPFLTAAARLGVDPTRCLVVEDAVAGVESGHAGGMKVLGIDSHADSRNGIVGSLGAEVVVPNLAAVRFVLDGDTITVQRAAN